MAVYHPSIVKDALYLFNSFGMLIPYCVVIALNFIFRFANYKNGECRIGMKKVAMIPLIAFDILVNVYLTSLFLVPLQGLYSYRNNPNSQTRTVALRTFVGSCCALTSSVVNLTLLLVLKGEPGWICLMCCNVDNNHNHNHSYTQDRENKNNNLPAGTRTGTVITTVTAGLGGKVTDAKEDEGAIKGEREISKPKMAIMVERDHVREVLETGIRIVDERERDREREKLRLSFSGCFGGGGIGIGMGIGVDIGGRNGWKEGVGDDADIYF
ncbi:hypothetical protein OCU04_008108 [Sclerotinia nivalis]|uniref:Uncharacterized protein n=1 Tax=Sclerotinia nivalis TaxID=352851 RepID=A0A9X0DHA8_9HELO|nr:hypothetical protein OCU04_008108 [Sclerotinia nivalis]